MPSILCLCSRTGMIIMKVMFLNSFSHDFQIGDLDPLTKLLWLMSPSKVWKMIETAADAVARVAADIGLGLLWLKLLRI